MKNTGRIHSVGTVITAVFLMIVMMLNVCSCHDSAYDYKVGISWLIIMSATGNKENKNIVSVSTGYQGRNIENMIGETALKLKDELLALPDVLGDENDPESYFISMRYYDDEHNEVNVQKLGYGQFPANWDLIVSYVNSISDRDKLTNSTDIVVVDAELLRREFDLTQSMLPPGVTVEQFIEDTDLNYFSLYDGYYNTKAQVMKYKYDYYNLTSHRIKNDTTASPSDSASLKEYAKANLDTIESESDICIIGDFMDYGFQIVRFDSFDTWKKENGVSGTVGNPDGTEDIMYDIDLHMEGMHKTETHYVYVDPSYRFLIITMCDEYDVINAYFNR